MKLSEVALYKFSPPSVAIQIAPSESTNMSDMLFEAIEDASVSECEYWKIVSVEGSNLAMPFFSEAIHILPSLSVTTLYKGVSRMERSFTALLRNI